MPDFTPHDFVSKWKRATAREKQTYQEHFINLCRLVGHQPPNEYDPTGTRFGFEIFRSDCHLKTHTYILIQPASYLAGADA